VYNSTVAVRTTYLPEGVEGVSVDHVHTHGHAEQWEEEPQAVAQPHKEQHVTHSLALVAFVEHVAQEVDHRTVELLHTHIHTHTHTLSNAHNHAYMNSESPKGIEE
jgi:hypothetical protein